MRKTATQNRCVGSLFTPAVKSARCTKLLTRTDHLVTETQTLRERVNELNMALAGRPSASKHVKSCNASRVASPKKPLSKTVHVPQQKSGGIAKPSVEMANSIALPAYETPAPVETEKVDYTSSATVQTSNITPAYVAPVATTPPVERPYTANAKVRVVGSGVLSGPINTSKSANSGPCACPVSASRKGMKRFLPLRPVAAFTASVQTFHV